jgi:two-component system OmpR family sensor kinase
MSARVRLQRLPLRVRLVAGFVGVMTGLLTAAGAFVYWRVQVDLDNRLNADVTTQAATAQAAWDRTRNPAAALAGLPAGALAQILNVNGTVLAHTGAATGLTLLPARDLPQARSRIVDTAPGNLLTSGSHRLRVLSLPLPEAAHAPVIAIVAVRLGQRDEALRELLAQLAVANLGALAIASVVGYRLTRAALLPVERYRSQAEQIAAGAAAVRLGVPPDAHDEISRLGHTLNRMLAAQEATAEQQRQFLADASHELRSPLTVLTSEVELALRRPRTTQEYEQTLHQVAIDTARLVTLTDQLLDLEHANQPSSVPAPAADAIAAATRAAVRARLLLEGTGRTVEVRTDHPPATAALPELNVDQILGNLTDNAVVHGTGQIRIHVESRVDGLTVLCVSDDGSGPPPDFIAHAVERFRRADPARTTPGNGLGLALVHSHVARAGGELRMCLPDRHHRYPPWLHDNVACEHPLEGTHLTVVLPAGQARKGSSP